MAETLRARVGRVIAGSLHALLDTLEDQAPEAMRRSSTRSPKAATTWPVPRSPASWTSRRSCRCSRPPWPTWRGKRTS